MALGPAPPGTAIATYDGSAGNWIVSVNDVSNWYIESPAGLLNGPDSPSPPLPLGGAGTFVTDNDFAVGETKLVLPRMTYTNVSLGNLSGIGANDDFKIHWVGELGSDEGWASVTIVPEPATIALAGMSVLGLLVTRRRRIA